MSIHVLVFQTTKHFDLSKRLSRYSTRLKWRRNPFDCDYLLGEFFGGGASGMTDTRAESLFGRALLAIIFLPDLPIRFNSNELQIRVP